MTDYDELQYNAARRFLQTTLIVDDRVSTEPEEEMKPEGNLVAPRTPGLRRGRGNGHAVAGESAEDGMSDDRETAPEADENGAESKRAQQEAEDAANVVHVKPLADHFADLNLTCGVLKPVPGEPPEEVTDRIARAARRVDIVVLDWMLDPKAGFTAEDAVKNVVSQDEYGRRLLAIYTTQRDLEGIAQRLETIERAHRVDGEELALQAGGTRIVIFHKGGPQLDDKWKDYERPESELPDTLVRVFARLSTGLVPAVALNALAATRENTHRLLERLDGGLDLGYLGHLLRLQYRDEGEQHLLDALSGEFRAVVEDDEDTRRTASKGFDAWLSHHAGQLRAPPESFQRLGEALADLKLKQWAREAGLRGLKEEDITGLLLTEADAAEARRSDARFAHLMAMRQPYSRPRPELHLGTIVREQDELAHYWLCIQPVCDSVRLAEDSPTPFLMLPLEPVDQGEKGVKSAFVVRSQAGDWLHLWPWDEASDIDLMRLRPNHHGAVQFNPIEGGGEGASCNAVTTEEGITLIWIAQLKTAHALRVAHAYGTKLTRVGLDESEWLRRLGREGRRPSRTTRVPAAARAARPASGSDVARDVAAGGQTTSPGGSAGGEPVESPADTRRDAGTLPGAGENPDAPN